ncbi:hypothetical protein Pfo_025339 [Paulownia fortunei]|nr:hypothetical protein Pfo_025339 [Paulownia fortunei]
MEEDQSHLNPLAPARKHRRSDEEFATYKPFNPPPSNHQERSSKCLVYILLAVVLQSIAFLIFGFVVLRIKTPSLRLSTVAIRDLRYGPASLNMTMVAEIRLHNMNFGRFKFRGGSTTLLYENATVGATNIYDGRVGSRDNREMNVTVKVMTGHELSENYMNFSRDIRSGLVKLRSFAKLRGEVRVVRIINRHRTAFMNCTMDLNLTSQAIQDFSCQ